MSVDLNNIVDLLGSLNEKNHRWYVDPETFKVESVNVDLVSSLKHNGFFSKRIEAEKRSRLLRIDEMLKHGRWDLAEEIKVELLTLEEDYPEWTI